MRRVEALRTEPAGALDDRRDAVDRARLVGARLLHVVHDLHQERAGHGQRDVEAELRDRAGPPTRASSGGPRPASFPPARSGRPSGRRRVLPGRSARVSLKFWTPQKLSWRRSPGPQTYVSASTGSSTGGSAGAGVATPGRGPLRSRRPLRTGVREDRGRVVVPSIVRSEGSERCPTDPREPERLRERDVARPEDGLDAEEEGEAASEGTTVSCESAPRPASAELWRAALEGRTIHRRVDLRPELDAPWGGCRAPRSCGVTTPFSGGRRTASRST